MTVPHTPRPEAHRTGYDEAARARLAAEAAQIVARYPNPRSALLPILHLVQSEDGYVSPRGVAFAAQTLGLSNAQVSAVATFYTQYKQHPNGTYTVGVCTTGLCAVMGGDAIWDEVAEHLGIGHDETTDDGAITLEKIECNAACDYAPVVMVNWEFFDNQTPGSAVALVDDLRAGRPVRPTRGADTVATFTEVSHVLAGFPDGRAEEGGRPGAPTLRGTLLARERGWTAPGLPDDAPVRSARKKASGATGDAPVRPARRKASGATDDAPVRSARRKASGATAPKVGEAHSSAQHPAPTGQRETTGSDTKAERKEP